MPYPDAVTAAEKFKAKLFKRELEAAARMSTVYGKIYTALEADAVKLAADIGTLEKYSPSKVLKLARTQALLNQVEEQAAKFAVVVDSEAATIASEATRQGVSDARALYAAALPDLPPELRNALTKAFTTLPADAIEAATGLIGPDSPLSARLDDLYGEYVRQQVEDSLLVGIGKGQNPKLIASKLVKNLQNGMGPGLSSAMTTVRTAQLNAYRTANHATYLANPDVVKGWIWHAELSPSTCMSCIAMHGTKHPMTERLNDHHNGRCRALPITPTYADLGLDIPEVRDEIQTGEDWFNGQSESIQRKMMGNTKYDAWAAGKIGFSDLSTTYDDAVYGTMRREATVKELTG